MYSQERDALRKWMADFWLFTLNHPCSRRTSICSVPMWTEWSLNMVVVLGVYQFVFFLIIFFGFIQSLWFEQWFWVQTCFFCVYIYRFIHIVPILSILDGLIYWPRMYLELWSWFDDHYFCHLRWTDSWCFFCIQLHPVFVDDFQFFMVQPKCFISLLLECLNPSFLPGGFLNLKWRMISGYPYFRKLPKWPAKLTANT